MSAELQPEDAQRKLSFPFAKRHGVLVRGIADGVADTVCRPGVTPQSLAEVRRFVGVPLKLERVNVEAFDLMLQHGAELGGNAVVGARYDATEVMQGVTEVLAYGTAVFVEPSK